MGAIPIHDEHLTLVQEKNPKNLWVSSSSIQKLITSNNSGFVHIIMYIYNNDHWTFSLETYQVLMNM